MLRQRSSWEAIDLGCAMTLQWWGSILGAWSIVVFPVALLISVIFKDYPFIALALIWWLKPLFDRLPLLVVSRSLFDHALTPFDVLRGLPHLLGKGLLPALTFRRLSPWRSYTMPIDHLEALQGVERRQRVKVITRDYVETALGLTAFCILCELCIHISALFFLAFLFSGVVEIEIWAPLVGQDELSTWLALLHNSVYILSMTAIEPFFVAAGFAIYLNRRVDLEGWDVELVFRRLAKRLSLKNPRQQIAKLLILAFFISAAETAHAQSTDVDPKADANAASAVEHRFSESIKAVLSRSEFNTKRKVGMWLPIGKEKRGLSEWDVDLSLLGHLAQFFAHLLFWLIIMAAALLVGFLLYHLYRQRPRLARQKRSSPQEPDPINSVIDLQPASLPRNLVEVAQQHWRKGERAKALSFLYRGALVHLIDNRGLEIPESATESECLLIASRQIDEGLQEEFSGLVRAWQQAAYGKGGPSDQRFWQLCEVWKPHLEKSL